MSNSSLFVFFNEYPVFPLVYLFANSIAFLPIFALLAIVQSAPLQNNCRTLRYIICVWIMSYGAKFTVNVCFAILDLTNTSGYMPVSITKPYLRFHLYQLHVMSTVFCSSLEIALSLERLIAIIDPRRYHISRTAWPCLIALTVSLAALAYAVEHGVHNVEAALRLVGSSAMITIEICVLVAGSIAVYACRVRYEKTYGKATLAERYQINEAYEMAKALMPTYIISFILKGSATIALGVYMAYINDYECLLGYLEVYYFLIDASYGSFSMIFMLIKHPRLRKQATRKLPLFNRVFPINTTLSASDKEATDLYFTMYSAHW